MVLDIMGKQIIYIYFDLDFARYVVDNYINDLKINQVKFKVVEDKYLDYFDLFNHEFETNQS